MEELSQLKKERISLSNEIYEKQNKIELLNSLYKDIEIQKNNKEGDIIKYQENEIRNKQIEENLEEKIKNLEKLNLEQNEEISKLKNIANNSVLDINKYIFKGVIMENDFNDKELFNKNIQLKLNSKDNFIKLYLDNKNMEVDAKKIKFTFYKNEKEKVMIFFEDEKGEKNVILCKFSEIDCENLFKFKKQINDNYEENKKNKEESSGFFF